MTELPVVVGIDLGTSNSAVARCTELGRSEVLPILQTVSADARMARALLPSALFMLPPHEAAATAGTVPWADPHQPGWIVGAYARERGAALPGRLVASSKSWLCNRLVDRREPILPWTAEEDLQKISPVQAAQEILAHIRSALAAADDASWLEQAQLVLTVPASFEESARALTAEAAQQAGWREVVMVEEPLAALYAWLEAHAESWRTTLVPGDVLLVCDVGGGTSDFSLIAVLDQGGELAFRRISVGDHILLGGDNMDLALAHLARQRLAEQGRELDAWQFATLVQAARSAKEALCVHDAPERHTVSIAARGSGLFAGAISVDFSRADVAQCVLDGFFPIVGRTDLPRERRAAGLREFGLPYAADAAITRHLAAFLARSARVAAQQEELTGCLTDGEIRPTKVLFNGGVFTAQSFRDRVLAQLQAWNPTVAVQELSQPDLECAVARGAAYYGGVVARGKALRIRAGLSRSYYIGVEPTELALPGIQSTLKGICIAPQGLEEGSSAQVAAREFILAAGEQIEFQLFTSAERSADSAGTEVSDAERSLQDGGVIRARIEAAEPFVPVVLESRLSEVGALEIALRESKGARSWRFEFDVRADVR